MGTSSNWCPKNYVKYDNLYTASTAQMICPVLSGIRKRVLLNLNYITMKNKNIQ